MFNTAHGDTSSVRLNFTLASSFPVNGKVKIIFPASFSYDQSLTGLSLDGPNLVGIDGTPSLAVLAETATISFSSNSLISSSTDISVKLDNAIIPPVTGTTDSFTVSTHESNDDPIDSVVLTQPQPFTPGQLTSLNAIAANTDAGATTDLTIVFRLENSILNDASDGFCDGKSTKAMNAKIIRVLISFQASFIKTPQWLNKRFVYM